MLSLVTRRSVLALLGLAAAPLPVARLAGPASVPLLDAPVVGLPYYDHRRVVSLLRPGDRMVLRRQPGNQADARAIEVLTATGVKLGYVPRRDNAVLAALMDAGAALDARLTERSTRAAPWITVGMKRAPDATLG